jgi:YHS domain-containing protein
MKGLDRAMKIILTLLALFGLVIFTPVTAIAADAPVYTSWRNNIAAGGYDAVSFFKGKPQEGKAEFSADYNGAEWHFQTQANRDLFLANPEAFAPAYGGYCAWAIANGKLAKGSPKYWYVQDGKLYLNYNARIRDRWLADKEMFITKADERWPTILED